MSFKSCIGKTVLIVTKTGEEFFGVVEDYLFPKHNGYRSKSIIMKTDGYLIEFRKKEIKCIEVV